MNGTWPPPDGKHGTTESSEAERRPYGVAPVAGKCSVPYISPPRIVIRLVHLLY